MMNEPLTPEAVTRMIDRYLEGEATADQLRDFLAECDAAIEAGRAGPVFSRPIAMAMLALIEAGEGVRPEADVRSTLLAVQRALTGRAPPPARPKRRPLPKPPRGPRR